jgi:hypothetical protein
MIQGGFPAIATPAPGGGGGGGGGGAARNGNPHQLIKTRNNGTSAGPVLG